MTIIFSQGNLSNCFTLGLFLISNNLMIICKLLLIAMLMLLEFPHYSSVQSRFRKYYYKLPHKKEESSSML